MVSKIFGGLSFRGDQGLLCRKMASAAQRWPFVNLRTDVFCESWFGESHPGHSEPRWHVNEKQELIYGERDPIRDSTRGPFYENSFEKSGSVTE